MVIDPFDTDVLYAGTDGDGVYKTVSAGASWTDKNVGLPGGTSVTRLSPTWVKVSSTEGSELTSQPQAAASPPIVRATSAAASASPTRCGPISIQSAA